MEKTKMIYDIIIIGGGINGCGIARDAAGRGLNVFLCDKNDLGAATSCSSSKLIHGGLRYLEHYEFGLVRKALHERQKLSTIAPHIIWPLNFILPHQRHLRPKWLIRTGLFLYDFLAPKGLAKSKSINLHTHPAGKPLKSEFTDAFNYTDCWVDDHRLVILNALDAEKHGATIRPYTACTKAEVKNNAWDITLTPQKGKSYTIQAKNLINATGPWAEKFIRTSVKNVKSKKLRLVKGSHIVVKKLFDHNDAYIFQTDEGRIVFALPYENDFTLIGTTDEEFTGDPLNATCEKEATIYLTSLANQYFKQKITEKDVIWSYAGVRPLIEDDNQNASKVTRDYKIELTKVENSPLINIWGGKLTTYRILAEDTLKTLKPHLKMGEKWTEHFALPGGTLSKEKTNDFLKENFPWLPEETRLRYARSYGTLSENILKEKEKIKDMGIHFGAGLYAAEIDYLIQNEWVKDAEAVLYRRTKTGLHLTSAQQKKVKNYISKKIKESA